MRQNEIATIGSDSIGVAVAKVKRISSLEGGTWDLEELGSVQHTSRWGTVARSKGSTLRYYPGCPWEKCSPPSKWLWEVILAIEVTRESHYVRTRLGVAIRRPGELRFNIMFSATTCRREVIADSARIEIIGFQEGRLLVQEEIVHHCEGSVPLRNVWRHAYRIPGCPAGKAPPGFIDAAFPSSEPRDKWWGPRTGKAWVVDCGTFKSCYKVLRV